MRVILPSLVGGLLTCAAGAQEIREFRFEAKTLGGQPISEEMFRNNVLIVDIWGTWCPPCRDAVPVLQRLYAKYKHHGLEIVGFNYEGAVREPERVVREFASDNGLTYHLAIGTPAIKAQVPGFRGYPTLLYFGRGLVHDHTDVGFSPGHEKKMERWVRQALGLAEEEAAAVPAAGEEERRPADELADPAEEELELPPGVIFKPGDADTGFGFEVTDVDGRELKFEDLRGSPVVLAMTSSWDLTAAQTAALLNRLHADYASRGAHVLAASLELKRQRAAKVAAIEAFAKKHGTKYRIFPAGLGFQKKIHLFSGMPLFLVFDAQGTLILREDGASEETEERIRAALQ